MPTKFVSGATRPRLASSEGSGKGVQMLTRFCAEQDSTPLQRGLVWSGGAHLLGMVLVVIGMVAWPRPAVPPIQDVTFTLVQNPSKTLPLKPDAKGDKAQLAGGRRRQIVDPVTVPPSPPDADKQPAVKKVAALSTVSPKTPIALAKTPIPEQPAKPMTVIKDSPASESAPVGTVPSPVVEVEPTAASSPGDAPSEQLAVTPDQMAPYWNGLKKALSAHWQPPRGEASLRVVTQFTIEADGRITDIVIKESSGDATTDAAARQALEASSPLAALPADWGVSRVPVLFRFDYTVFGQGRAK